MCLGVQAGICYLLGQVSATRFIELERSRFPRNIDIPWNIVEYGGILWNIAEYCGISERVGCPKNLI